MYVTSCVWALEVVSLLLEFMGAKHETFDTLNLMINHPGTTPEKRIPSPSPEKNVSCKALLRESNG